LTERGKCGSRVHVFATANGRVTDDTDAAARFAPKLEKPEKLFVYVTWPRAANATPVYYIVHHAKGEEKVALVQDGWGKLGDPNANNWVPLGQFDFAAGDDQYVEVRAGSDIQATDPKNIGRLYSDSARFSADELTTGVAKSVPIASARSGETAAAEPAAGAAAGGGEVKWQADLAAAQEQAGKNGRKILVFFAAPGSAASDYLETVVFKDPKVAGLLSSRYVPVRINFFENADTAYRLKVFRGGTVAVYDSKGNPLDLISDRLTIPETVSRLTR
jgi:hypothetical protein